MKSVINKTAMKLTALTVALLIALSCTLNMTFTATGSEGDTTYGTEADGVTGNVKALAPIDTFENGDFSQGLKYWGQHTNSGTAKASDVASIKTEGENTYLEINREEMQNSTYGVLSVPFKISGLSVGDEIHVYFDYKMAMNPANTSGQEVFWAKLNATDGAVQFTAAPQFRSARNTDITKWTRTSFSGTVSSIPESGEAAFYLEILINYGPAARVDIDNIVVAVRDTTGDDATPDDCYELLDGTVVGETELNPNMYGTAEDGITGNALGLKTQSELKNGDFESGLKYWGGYNKKDNAYEDVSTEKDGDNTYLVVNRETGDNSYAHGVLSVPFKISGLSVGDEVYVYFDYKVKMAEANTSGQRVLWSRLWTADGTTEFEETAQFYTPAKTDIEKWTRASFKGTVSKVNENGVGVFYVSFAVNWCVAAKISVDNVVIALRDTTGDDITPEGYYELPDGTVVTEADLNPAMYGTVEDGVSGDATALKAQNNLKNGDFSDGLRFWGSYNKKNMTFESVSLKKDGDNPYLEINCETGDNDNAHGVLSVPFKIGELSVGDEVYVYFDYRVKMNEANVSGQKVLWSRLWTTDGTTEFDETAQFYTPAKTDIEKWTKAAVKGTVSKIAENGNGVFYVSFAVNYCVAAKLDIDNVVVAVCRKSGDNATPDGYYELLDGTLVTEFDLNPNMYGTAEDGVSGDATALKPLNVLKNADFSDGLKYWGSYNKKNMAFENVSLKKDGNNSYLEINCETGDNNAAHGVVSVPFKINGLSAGDEVYAYFDYKVQMNEANTSGQRVLWSRLWTGNDSTELAANTEYFTPAKTNVAKWTKASMKGIVSKTDENGNGVFYISFAVNYCVAAKIDVDNIVIAVRDTTGSDATPDGYFELLDGTVVTEFELNPNMFGTTDDGIAGNALELKTQSALMNGDFESGLKYWGNQSKSGLASAAATVETKNGNSYLVIDRTVPENAAQGVITAPFKISELKAGDVIAITYDYKVQKYDNSIAGTDFYVNFRTTDESLFKISDGKSNMTISGQKPLDNKYVTATDGYSTAAAQMLVSEADENAAFYIHVYLQYKAACKLYFDNFTVYVKHNSGANKTPNGYYETLDGKLVDEKLFDGCTVSTGTTDVASGANDTNYPGLVYSWIGTEENGIYSEQYYLGNKFPVRTKYMNADFSKGLQYWFDSASTGYTSQNVKLKTEKNGNSYVTVGENGTSYQLNQTHFWLEGFDPGDKVYIMVKFRRYGQFGCNGYVRNAVDSPALSLTRAHGNTRVVYEPETDDDWGISISSAYITIPHLDQLDPNASDIFGGKIAYYMMINGSKEADISAIMLVRKNADGTYTDSDGNVITVPKNTNNYHYSAEDGFNWSNNLLTGDYGAMKLSSGLVIPGGDKNTSAAKDSNNVALIIVLAATGLAVLGGGTAVTVFAIKRRRVKNK